MPIPTAERIAAVRSLGANATHTRRNHRLGVAAGAFAGMAQDFTHPSLIMAALILSLTDSVLLASLVPVISKLGALAPQLLASGLMEHHDRRRPQFVILTVLRTVSYAALTAAIWLLTLRVDALTLAVFYAAYLATCIVTGASIVTFTDMIGRLIPAHRIGSFLGMRQLLGGGLAVLAGLLVIQPILSGVALPWNYFLLAAIGTLLVGIDMSIWSGCREAAGPKARQPSSLGESLRRGMRWLRTDLDYRCYLWMRVAFRINYVGLAMFIPYGEQRLAGDTPGGVAVLAGILVATMKFSSLAASVLWGHMTDRYGSRVTLIAAGLLFTASPLLALLAPALPPLFSIPVPGSPRGIDLPLVVYMLALACVGAAVRANMIGGRRMLINAAPPHRRASYLAFLNTITSPLTLLPLVGAALAEWAGMTTLFVCIVAGGVLALWAALRMNDDRPAARTLAA